MSIQQSTNLGGKLAIVTGGSRGIGAAIAENLARKGADVFLNYTSNSSQNAVKKLALRLHEEYKVMALPVQADIGSLDGPASIVASAKDAFEKGLYTAPKFVIDIIINNAGISINKSIQECNPEDFALQYNVNVRGPLLLLKAALPYLPRDRSGRIVNVSSVSSQLGYATQSVYGGTKAALEAMTRTWARELAERATVNAVNPGPVATDMYGLVSEAFVEQNRPFLENTPLAAVREGADQDDFIRNVKKTGGRPAHEEEIAGLVGLLCSKEAGFTTGSVLCANGGMKFVS